MKEGGREYLHCLPASQTMDLRRMGESEREREEGGSDEHKKLRVERANGVQAAKQAGSRVELATWMRTKSAAQAGRTWMMA